MELELATLQDIHKELRRRYDHVMIILAGTEAGDDEPSIQVLDRGCPEGLIELAQFAIDHPEAATPILEEPDINDET